MKRDNHFHSRNMAASSSLIIARIFYGVNWFNVAAIFPLISVDFGQDISLLGYISAAFLIGVGIFQIPAGIFAAKYTSRTSAVFGIAMSSTAALIYAFSSEASELIWLRFIVGAGMAFFFSSGVTLIARYSKPGSSGFSIGLMNSAHSVGGIIGIFVWIIIAQTVGWRLSLVLSGAIGILTAVMMIIAIPRERSVQTTKEARASSEGEVSNQSSEPLIKLNTWKILSNGPLIALGLVLTGVQAAWALLLTFIVVHLQSLNILHEGTGAIASLALISSIVSAPLVGGFYDRAKDVRKILMICGAGISISLAAISTQILPVIIVSVIAVGFFSGGAFTVAYTKARRMQIITGIMQEKNERKRKNIIPESRRGIEEEHIRAVPDYSALNVAWINGLSLLGVLWMPPVFSLLVKSWGGYPAAWLLSAISVALLVSIPLRKVEK
jgi:MFS family permease